MSPHPSLGRQRDKGFALSELLVVLALLSVVLGGIYSFSYAVSQSARVNEFQSTAARETGNALWIIEKYLMQEIRIDSAAPNRIQFITDEKLDGNLKRHVVEAHADGRITLSTWATARTSGWPNVGSPAFYELARSSSNVADGTQLFEYFRGDGSTITGSDIAEAAPSDTRSVRVTIQVNVGDWTHDDSRFITLRNRE